MRLARRFILIAMGVLIAVGIATHARADEVLYWNGVLRSAIVTAGTPGALQPRIAAIVHGAMFDAINGIERRYTTAFPAATSPVHGDAEAPRGASRRAAVVQAAYTTLTALFPSQAATFAAALETSLDGIAADAAQENSRSIQRGREWGERVANDILAWRNGDGLNPIPTNYVGSNAVGKWRPTPPAFAHGLAPSLATTLTFVVPNGSTFRPAGPPPLASTDYADAFNEVKSVGESTSATRTADQTQSARFWAATALTFWFRAAEAAATARNTTLSENARLFAILAVGMTDAVITCWDSKYHYELWRPITAIDQAATDGNAATAAQAGWTPLIVTPPYPEYYSGHQSISRTSAAILTAYFGDMPVSGFSEGLPGVTRSWSSFTEAADEAFMARIWGGIHFRFGMTASRAVAETIAAYVLANAAQPINGNRTGQLAR